ncbi:MAG: hypothetical protein E4G90_08310 [Gemmatimonadales bacterium]|nr:MAG: hypothetical protein E4G90_08310 [Gemmatimonadales bacterium]
MTLRRDVWFGVLALASACVTNPPDVPRNPDEFALTIVDGNQQAAQIGQRLPRSYVTRATRMDIPMANLEISWTVSVGSGTVDPTSSFTDTEGLAQTTHTLGLEVGSQEVRATFAGIAEAPQVTFITKVELVPAPPRIARVPIPANYGIHDTFVRDGIAFVSAWNSGIIIFDVGGGGHGGTTAAPIQMGALVTNVGPLQTPSAHNAWWFHNPVTHEARYLFVGQEGPGTLGASSSGDLHVLGVSDLTNPTEVAFFHLPGAGVHNFWMDEARQMLYAAYYNGGVVALDVSGVFMGDLDGRLLANTLPGGPGSTHVWGVMLAGGSLYVSDMISGFWRLDPETLIPTGGGWNVPERFGSDLWATEAYAYTGTWGSREAILGNVIKIWDLGTGGLVLVDSVIVPGIRTVSDLQVSDDGRVLVASAEGAEGAGIYVYGLTEPDKPVLLGMVLVDTGIHTVTLASIAGKLYAFGAKNPGNPALEIYDLSGFVP